MQEDWESIDLESVYSAVLDGDNIFDTAIFALNMHNGTG